MVLRGHRKVPFTIGHILEFPFNSRMAVFLASLLTLESYVNLHVQSEQLPFAELAPKSMKQNCFVDLIAE